MSDYMYVQPEQPTHKSAPTVTTGGTRAMVAILQQAFLDLEEHRFIPPNSHYIYDAAVRKWQQVYVDAHLWMASKRTDYPCAFERVCESLNFDPQKFRRKFKISTHDSFFGTTEVSVRDPEQ